MIEHTSPLVQLLQVLLVIVDENLKSPIRGLLCLT
nr:MAG TPA: IBV 3A protein [Caudoviricetes sp.]